VFERFDAFGRKRDQENGLPIDATGSVHGAPEGDVPLDGIDSLSSYLARSPQATGCLIRYLSYSSFGLDRCDQDTIAAELAGGDGSLKSLVKAIAHAPQFATRNPD
jgi:hypothetical protein